NDRVIDLSYAAAYMLGFHNKGTAMVEIEAVLPGAPSNMPILADTAPAAAPAAAVTSPATSSAAGSLSAAAVTQPTLAAASTASGIGQYLQVGAFADLAAAQRLIAKLQTMTSRPVFIRSVDAENTTLHRVRIGPIPEVAEI